MKEVLERIAKQFQLADIYVFGSRAREIQDRVEGKKKVSFLLAGYLGLGDNGSTITSI